MIKMNVKKICMALVVFSMLITGTASADVIGTSKMTGYTYMSGLGSYTTYPGDDKDYFVVSNLELFGGDEDMWGYSWVKFDVTATETVESAYLVLDLLGVGSMTAGNPPDATETLPALLNIYDPGNVDVETLTAYGDDANVTTLKNTLLGESAISSLTMTANGTYSLDITDLYNSWVEDPDSNNGIVLASGYVYEGWIPELTQEYFDSLKEDEELYNAYSAELFAAAAACGSVYASFDRDGANAPYISTTAVSSVPVPGSIFLLGAGLVSFTGVFRRRNL